MHYRLLLAAMTAAIASSCLAQHPCSTQADKELNNEVYPFRDAKSGKWGFINRTGEITIRATFNGVTVPKDGFIRVNCGGRGNEALHEIVKGGRYGIISQKGAVILPVEYDYIGPYSDKCFTVTKNGRWYCVNACGEEVLDLGEEYDYVGPFVSGTAVARKSMEATYIDARMRPITREKFPWAYDFKDGLARVVQKQKNHKVVGFINTTGKMAIPGRFAAAYPFAEGFAAINIGGKVINGEMVDGGLWGYIDARGEIVIKPSFAWTYRFSEGLAMVNVGGVNDGVCRGGKYGYINPKGELVIKAHYIDALIFQEGLAAVQDERNGKWGFIDKTNKTVIPFRYDFARSFWHGLAYVKEGKWWKYIDRTGKTVWTQEATN